MPKPDRSKPQCLEQFRLALAENVSMAEAARRLAQRQNDARYDDAKKLHGEAMRRLYAKGYGRRR